MAAVAQRMLAEAAQQQLARSGYDGMARASHVSAVTGVLVMREPQPSALTPTCYDPVVCLVVQGAKDLVFGQQRLRCRAGDSVVVSHAVPVMSRVVEASDTMSYLAVILPLDRPLLTRLAMDLPDHRDTAARPDAVQVAPADPGMLDAVTRLLEHERDPIDARALGPLVTQELHHRLLRSTHGPMLRAILRAGSHAERIDRVVRHLREDLARRTTIEELAGIAHMSTSTLHQHFKAVTGTTPVRYLKRLRLLEAQRHLLQDGLNVTQAAHAVGYASTNQFSRDFAREFGCPPSKALQMI